MKEDIKNMLRRTIETIATVFTLLFIATFSPIVQHVNRRRRKNAPETSSAMEYHPYKIPRKELENPKGFDDYSFNKIIRDNFAGKAASEREDRSREEDEEIDEILKGIASLMNEERSRMYRSFLDEELLSREGNEDAFFNHHYITPRITESKIVTRNVNVHYIGRKPMINRPVARTRRRQRAVFSRRKVFIFLVYTVGREPKTVVR